MMSATVFWTAKMQLKFNEEVTDEKQEIPQI